MQKNYDYLGLLESKSLMWITLLTMEIIINEWVLQWLNLLHRAREYDTSEESENERNLLKHDLVFFGADCETSILSRYVCI